MQQAPRSLPRCCRDPQPTAAPTGGASSKHLLGRCCPHPCPGAMERLGKQPAWVTARHGAHGATLMRPGTTCPPHAAWNHLPAAAGSARQHATLSLQASQRWKTRCFTSRSMRQAGVRTARGLMLSVKKGNEMRHSQVHRGGVHHAAAPLACPPAASPSGWPCSDDMMSDCGAGRGKQEKQGWAHVRVCKPCQTMRGHDAAPGAASRAG